MVKMKKIYLSVTYLSIIDLDEDIIEDIMTDSPKLSYEQATEKAAELLVQSTLNELPDNYNDAEFEIIEEKKKNKEIGVAKIIKFLKVITKKRE